MDNIAVEAYSLSCLLPLLAFVLLTVQFCSRSPNAKLSHVSTLHRLEDFPCNLGGLITIADEVPSKHVHQTATSTINSKSSKTGSSEPEKCMEKVTNMSKRERSFTSRWVLEGCNAGLSRMIYMNRLYFATRKDEIMAKGFKEHRKKKANVGSRDWF